MDENWLHEKIAEISRTIYSYCRAKTPSQQDAEDLSQDILLELTKSVKNIRNENAFYAFMWGVAGNVYKQWYRKKLKNNTCELSEDIPSEDQLSEDDSERLYLLRRELTLLSEKYRKATILYYIEGRSCSEISDLLAISESMVKYLLFKSRKILKEGMNIEKAHEERYRALLKNVETKAVFEKSGVTVWECRNCGHIVVGVKAPEVCPVCNHPQAYFEVRKENY